MKLNLNKILNAFFLIIIITTFTITGCNNERDAHQLTLDNNGFNEFQDEPAPDVLARVGTDNLPLRSGPSFDDQIIKSLNYGTVLKIIDENTGWLKVEINIWHMPQDDLINSTIEGWLQKEFVLDLHDPEYETAISSTDKYDPSLPLLISFWQPGDYYWNKTGYEFYLYKDESRLLFGTKYNDIKILLGEPERVEVIEGHIMSEEYKDPDMWILQYPSLTIKLYWGEVIENAKIVGMEIYDSEIIGPRGIKVGDSLVSLLNRFPNEGNNIVELDDNVKYEQQGEMICFHQIIYKYSNGWGPYAYIGYNESSEAVYAVFLDREVGGFYTGRLIVFFEKGIVTHYILDYQYT